MSKATIAIVEDEEDIREIISYNLKRDGYTVVEYGTGESALEGFAKERPDIILLDLMLPGIDGLEVCKAVRKEAENIPIIMLTAKGEEVDMVTGLELGADDYIPKPFSPRVVLARVKAVLRRQNRSEVTPETPSGLSIDQRTRTAILDGSELDLTWSEFQLLTFLARRPGWVYSRYEIVDAIRGEDYIVTERAVDVQIAGLRKKLGKQSKLIETVRGVGYRFKKSE